MSEYLEQAFEVPPSFVSHVPTMEPQGPLSAVEPPLGTSEWLAWASNILDKMPVRQHSDIGAQNLERKQNHFDDFPTPEIEVWDSDTSIFVDADGCYRWASRTISKPELDPPNIVNEVPTAKRAPTTATPEVHKNIVSVFAIVTADRVRISGTVNARNVLEVDLVSSSDNLIPYDPSSDEFTFRSGVVYRFASRDSEPRFWNVTFNNNVASSISPRWSAQHIFSFHHLPPGSISVKLGVPINSTDWWRLQSCGDLDHWDTHETSKKTGTRKIKRPTRFVEHTIRCRRRGEDDPFTMFAVAVQKGLKDTRHRKRACRHV